MQSLFTGIDWRQTLIVNSIRAALSGVVLGVLLLIFGDDQKMALTFLFFMVPIFWIMIFPLSYIVQMLSDAGIPFIWLYNFMWSVMMSLGDPIYFFIGRLQKWVPHTPDQSPFSLLVYFLILREDVPHVSKL